MKTCSRCHRAQPEDCFYRDRRSHDGLKSQCKSCHLEGAVRTRDRENSRRLNREHMRRARARDPEKFRRREREAARARDWDDRREARYQLNRAVRNGHIQRPVRCERCGDAGPLEGHHPDYGRPLSVEWLCSLCHGMEHRHAA